MKKIIRLTENDLNNIIIGSVKRILKEDVLGNDWNVNDDNEDNVFNNYEPFENQIDKYEAEDEYRNQHDWSGQGEDEFDPTFYEDPDNYRDDVLQTNNDPSDGDLYMFDNN